MPHSEAAHALLVTTLASSDYLRQYLAFCDLYAKRGEVGRARLDLGLTLKTFQNNGAQCRLERRFKVFLFDEAEVSGWRWQGSLVVQRHDGLEAMIEGRNVTDDVSAGSTFLALAVEVGREARPPVEIGPPYPRPHFDGDMQTIDRMVPDLLQLFRSMEAAIKQGWPQTGVPAA